MQGYLTFAPLAYEEDLSVTLHDVSTVFQTQWLTNSIGTLTPIDASSGPAFI
jgi:hypothetical protein